MHDRESRQLHLLFTDFNDARQAKLRLGEGLEIEKVTGWDLEVHRITLPDDEASQAFVHALGLANPESTVRMSQELAIDDWTNLLGVVRGTFEFQDACSARGEGFTYSRQ